MKWADEWVDKCNRLYDTADANVCIWRNSGNTYVVDMNTFECKEASRSEVDAHKPEKSFYKDWLCW